MGHSFTSIQFQKERETNIKICITTSHLFHLIKKCMIIIFWKIYLNGSFLMDGEKGQKFVNLKKKDNRG